MKPRIATLDGIYILADNGFYEPESEPETRYRWRGKALIAIAVLSAFVWIFIAARAVWG